MNTRRRSMRLRSRSNSKLINGFHTPEKQIISNDDTLLPTPDSISSSSRKLNIVKKRLFSNIESGDDKKHKSNNTTTTTLCTPCKRQQVSPISPAPSPQKLVFGKDSIYSRTKSLLQRSAGLFASEIGCLITREEQFNKIIDFLDSNISNNTSSSLYITGPPGTGKTAQLNSIIKNRFSPVVISQQYQSQNKQKLTAADSRNSIELFPDLKNQCYFQLNNGQKRSVVATLINCIALSEPNMIFNQIYESFNVTDNTKRLVKTVDDLKHYMESFDKRITFLVVLDEIDKLLYSSNNDTIATKIILDLFLLAKSSSLNFLLIGVANSLDLKDRFLSRLNLKQDLLPGTIVFHPYSSEEMFEIVMNRIKTIKTIDGVDADANSKADADVDRSDVCIFNPVAIKFASKKCSGSTGDIRKLFDVLRSSIELVELEVIKQIKTKPDVEKTDSTRGTTNSFNLIKVGMPHVAKVFAQINNNVSTRSRISRLNMQQRIILCSLVNRESIDVFHNSCSLDDAFDYYKQFLQRRDSVMKPLNRNEFIEIANNLETCGVVTMSHGRAVGKTKHIVKMIQTSIDKNEFEEEIRKMDILKRFI